METSVKSYESVEKNQSTNNNNNNESKDEVDFVLVAKNHNNNNNDDNYDSNSKKLLMANKSENVPNSATPQPTTPQPVPKSKAAKTPIEKPNAKERISIFSFGKKSGQKAAVIAAVTTNGVEKTEPPGNGVPSTDSSAAVTMGTAEPATRPHKYVKSTSISRLLGNTYNAKKFEKAEQKRLVAEGAGLGKFNTYGGRRRTPGAQLERFKRYSKEDGDEVVSHAGAITGSASMTTDSRDLYGGTRNELVSVERTLEERHEDLGVKAMRTISRGLGKLWWKRSHSVDISTPDPEFKVSYLGNVLTGWAKGEGCVEKQLNTLWRNYTQNNKPDVIMRIKVCASGLKATTRQHGLTEYWANRITHCCAPKSYPRVFCWIYRHEGRKLKHELRCHAVLCSKEKVVQDICNTLKENLESALREFKREKILRQNARLSLANAVYDNPSLPRRKILLSVGGNNYRPPLERSKSAPKLMAIEEAIGEEEGDEIEETNEPEMKSCCQRDSLYPAMTLGRRRCRRGHSIRRTGKTRPSFDCAAATEGAACCQNTKEAPHCVEVASVKEDEEVLHHSSDDSDDFEKVLKHNNYDSSASLANELMPYFDMSLHKNTSCSLGSLSELKDEYDEPLSLQHTINSDPNAAVADYHTEYEEDEHPSLRRNGVCSDGEEDYLEGDDDLYFRQASILNMLHRNSMRKMAHLSLSSDEGSSLDTNVSSLNHPHVAASEQGSANAPDSGSVALQYRHQMQSSISSNASSTASATGGPKHQHQNHTDSDEGSISSGCETASTVTANQDDLSLNYRPSKQELLAANACGGGATDADLGPLSNDHELFLNEPAPESADEIYQRLESRLQKRHNSDATTFSSSSSITLKMGNATSTASVNGALDLDDCDEAAPTRAGIVARRCSSNSRRQRDERDFSDSECSDESGYVEFQGKEQRSREVNGHGERSLAVDTPTVENVEKEKKLAVTMMNKPQPPPKPMPRRLLTTVKANVTTTV